MLRRTALLTLSVAICGFACHACARGPEGPEITDPAEAAKDPDFLIQGEYLGNGTWLDGEHAKVVAQVIALGNGKFDLVVTKGGLPGDGWKRGDAQFSLTGKRDGDVTTVVGASASGKISGEAMTLASSDGKAKLELKRTVRHSSTEVRESARRGRRPLRRHERRQIPLRTDEPGQEPHVGSNVETRLRRLHAAH